MRKVYAAAILVLIPAAVAAGSWYERPDSTFHAHPLVEISTSSRTFVRARVIRALREPSRSSSGLVRAEISSGIYTGEHVHAKVFYGMSLRSMSENDKIIISYLDDEGPSEVLVDSRDRLGIVILLFLIFASLAVTVGGKKCLYSLGALFLGVSVSWVLISKVISSGHSPLLYSLYAAFAVVAITSAAVGGLSGKGLAAAAGASAGLATAAFTGWIFFYAARIGGFYLEEFQLINYMGGHSSVFFNEFLAGMLVLGATGLVIDAAVSVASAMTEIRKNLPGISRWELKESGLAVGRDISSTMATTLIMAYLGGSLGILLVRSLHIGSLTQLLNMEFFHVALYSALLGTCAFLISVRITAWLGSRII